MIDIQAGDVVVCVDAGPHRSGGGPCRFIKRSNLYRVDRLWFFDDYAYPSWVVTLVGVPTDTSSGGYGLWRFRKVKPATEEFTARIKAVRPIKQREDA
jgi:hypothetical protein